MGHPLTQYQSHIKIGVDKPDKKHKKSWGKNDFYYKSKLSRSNEPSSVQDTYAET